jgi:nicotinamidase-related amidase
MRELPVPPHFRADGVGEIWRVPYEERAREARAWAAEHGLAPAAGDARRVAVVCVDVQNTFCVPGFELFVIGAVDDNRRLCEFVYRNLGAITQVVASLDTHRAMQVFHAIWLVDEHGEPPPPHTRVSAEDVVAGRWRVDEDTARAAGIEPAEAGRHLAHYTRRLADGGKYDLTVWPYHAMLGGIGHALVSAFEEAVFFHTVARRSQPVFEVKGDRPLTEHYSLLGPEVTEGPGGEPLGRRNAGLVERLTAYDAVVVAGQAKSHCLAWTIDDLLSDRDARERGLAERMYLLEDCTSPIVVPGLVDYTAQADAAFERYARAGMHVVRSTDPLRDWPGPISA